MESVEDLYRLTKENNLMLKYICAKLIQNEKKADGKNLLINLVADLLVDNLGNRNK